MALLIEGRREKEKQLNDRLGWLHWVLWQPHAREELKLEDFLPGKSQEVSAKKNPEAFAAELARRMQLLEQREQRKRKRKDRNAQK